VTDDDFLVLFNAHHEAIPFRLPQRAGGSWLVFVDTSHGEGLEADGTFVAGTDYPLAGRALALLVHSKGPA
jgi:glycogen operon protein